MRINPAVRDEDVLNQPRPGAAHYADAALAVVNHAVFHHDVADNAVDIAEYHRFRNRAEDAVGNREILAGNIPARDAGQRNAVVARGNIAAADDHVPAGAEVQAVVVRYRQVVVDRQVQELQVFADMEGRRPARGVDNADVPVIIRRIS